MKTLTPHFSQLGGSWLFAAVVIAFTQSSNAQLNDAKVERDATGVYSGSTSGGKYSVDYVDPFYSDQTFDLEPASLKARIPVKDGRLSSVVKDSDFPGNDKVVCNGVEQRSDVKRGGKQILVAAKGTVKPDNGPERADWTGGKASGTLTDKGPKWFAKTSVSAKQVNSAATTPFTATARGINFKGNG